MKIGENLIWEQTHPVDWIRMEYARRRAKNPQYSLRAFAKFLSLPSGPLSEIFTKKRKLSSQVGKQIASKLGYSLDQENRFLSLIQKWEHPTSEILPTFGSDGYRQIELDQIVVLENWYYFAILCLLETENFLDDERWISKRLGISTVEVRAAFERLERLKMIERVEGRWIGTGHWSSPDKPSDAGRTFLRQSLEQALDALDHIPNERRDHTSITMAMDPKKLPMAIKMIEKFRKGLSKFLEEGEKTEVYKLNVQIFPVTKSIEVNI